MKAVRLSHRGIARDVRADGATATIDGRPVAFGREEGPGPVVTVTIGGVRHRVAAVRAGDRTFVWCDGRTWEFEDGARARASAGADHHGGLVSPMPGRVRRVLVADGAPVERGQALLTLEAMKMEHSIRAPRDGRVRRVCVAEGELVDAGVELVELDD